jgi:hypothetical protein
MNAVRAETASAAGRLTVLVSISNLYATKRICRDRKTSKFIKSSYGCETHFQVRQLDLKGFDHLCKSLERLTKRSSAFVIRGEPLPGIDVNKTRRLIHPDPAIGDPATFAAAARRWFAVDIDKVRKPVAIDPVTDPDGAIQHVIGLLPPELHDASCWWQFTCSQSLPGSEDTLSARLWFWSHDPLDDASLTRWALAANKSAVSRIIDPSLYRAVQPHYVADPIFENLVDPLPRRHGVRVGLDTSVSLLIPEPPADDPYVAGEGYIGLGVEGHLAEIGGERGFRGPMLSAIAAYFTGNPDADPEPIKAKVREAINRADPGGRSAADIGRYCSDRHLNDIVGWIRLRERVNPRSTAPHQTPGEFLQSLRNSVPVGSERIKAVRAIAQHLLRQRNLNPHLAVSLVDCFNQARCTPPLPLEQVRAITASLAVREIERANNA